MAVVFFNFFYDVRFKIGMVFLLVIFLQEVEGGQNCSAVSKKTCEIAHDLKRGINLGNMLDAPKEGDWGIRFEPDYVDLIAEKFDTVRIPVRWSNNAAVSEDATINQYFFNRVESIVESFLKKDMYVIINMHHYNQMFGSSLHRKEFAVDDNVVEARFLNMWRQISERFKDKSPRLLFELLNEPHGRLGDKKWNALSQKVLDVVREANPNRTVLIGPTSYNSPKKLSKLVLPKDKNIIVSIHSYTPISFAFQGITFLPMDLPVGVTCCGARQKKEIIVEFDSAVRWNKKSGYPLHLGEFGTYNKAGMDSRVEYTRFVRKSLEERGIGWAYWEFGSGFGIYNPKTKQWREPLVEALVGAP